MHSTDNRMQFNHSPLAALEFTVSVAYALPLQRKLSIPDQKGLTRLHDGFREELSSFDEILLESFFVQLVGEMSDLYTCQNKLILAMHISILDWSECYQDLGISSVPIVFGLVNVCHTWELWCMKHKDVWRQHCK